VESEEWRERTCQKILIKLCLKGTLLSALLCLYSARSVRDRRVPRHNVMIMGIARTGMRMQNMPGKCQPLRGATHRSPNATGRSSRRCYRGSWRRCHHRPDGLVFALQSRERTQVLMADGTEGKIVHRRRWRREVTSLHSSENVT
jgi:hypothetical protein